MNMRFFLHFLVQAFVANVCLASIDDRLLELETIVRIKSLQNEKLKNRVIELENETAEMIASDLDLVEQLQHDVGGVKPGVTWREPDVVETLKQHRPKRSGGITPASHAYLSNQKCHTERETIIFDTEVVDRGGYGDVGNYDKRDGIFEPPTSGVYAFTWTIAAPPHIKITTELVISGSVVGVMTTDSDLTLGVGSGVHPATGFVIADVTAGSHCYIRVRRGDGDCSMVLSASNYVRTTFSTWEIFSV